MIEGLGGKKELEGPEVDREVNKIRKIHDSATFLRGCVRARPQMRDPERQRDQEKFEENLNFLRRQIKDEKSQEEAEKNVETISKRWEDPSTVSYEEAMDAVDRLEKMAIEEFFEKNENQN